MKNNNETTPGGTRDKAGSTLQHGATPGGTHKQVCACEKNIREGNHSDDTTIENPGRRGFIKWCALLFASLFLPVAIPALDSHTAEEDADDAILYHGIGWCIPH